MADESGGESGYSTGIAGLLLAAASTLIIFAFGRRSG
jgi:hypothetical protein